MKNKLLKITALLTSTTLLFSALPVYADNPDPVITKSVNSDNCSPDHTREMIETESVIADNDISNYTGEIIENDEEPLHKSVTESLNELESESEFIIEPEPETEQELETEEIITFDDPTDSDALLQGYLDQCFYSDNNISLFRSFSCGENLSGQTRKLYDSLLPLLKEVAAGNQTSTIFQLESSAIMEKTQYTSQELGVDAVNEENARTLASTCISYDARLLLDSLMNDLPYELFWFNKQNGGMKITYTLGYTSGYLRIKQFKISFTVSDAYQGTDSYTVNAEKINSIHTSVANARALVDEAAGLKDLEKIEFYKTKICDLTEYDHAAASVNYAGGYGDPWQLIYVFDNDPTTKVVCEGYAKAFQYLMDQTAFSSWDIYSILVSGTKSGGKHMWNIVHMDDARNYLVDVTANDSYRLSDPQHRFMEIPDDGDVNNGYTYNSKSSGGIFINGSIYQYDQDTRNLYAVEDLLLSETEYGKQPEPKLICKNDAGDELIYKITAKNLTGTEPSDTIMVAVWSRENGQDDIKWYTMPYSEDEHAFQTEVAISQHKSAGIYDAHLYQRSASGTMTYLTRSIFEIHAVQAEKLTAEVNKNTPGTALVTISGVNCPSGVSRVQFPIWSKSNQSDIVWYEGNKISEGVYQVTLDIARHGFNTGTYHIHAYGTSGIGARNFLLNTTCELKAGDPSVRAVRNTSDYTITATGLNNGDVKEIRTAIWSANNGQDDLIWYTYKPTASGAGSVAWMPKESGLHYIHCYILNNAGKLIFQKGIEEVVPQPSAESIKATADNTSGAFSIRISGLSAATGINKVQLAVWSDPKQKDIIWYNASKAGERGYSVNSNISKHGFRTGLYHAHLYITDRAGKMIFTGSTNFEVDASVESFKADYNSSEKTCSVLARGICLPFEADHMSFAVWSEKDGQDDLKWYNTSLHSGQTTMKVTIADHKNTPGYYYVHLYAITKTGAYIFVGNTGFHVE